MITWGTISEKRKTPGMGNPVFTHKLNPLFVLSPLTICESKLSSWYQPHLACTHDCKRELRFVSWFDSKCN